MAREPPQLKKPQLKGWRKRWEEQNLDRRIEKSLQTLQRIKYRYQLEECIRALCKELGEGWRTEVAEGCLKKTNIGQQNETRINNTTPHRFSGAKELSLKN
jgi:hypothetical protein